MTTSDNTYCISQQLIDQIKNELNIHGGRTNTIDLAKELKVDLDELNLNVSELIRAKEVYLVAEYLIAHYYIEEIAREINFMLLTQGRISVDDLTLQFDLSADVLQHDVLEKYLGTIISGRQDSSDPKIFYTEEYITRSKAKLRGALMGFLRPTLVMNISDHLNLTEGLFLYLFQQLNDTGVVSGSKFFRMEYVPFVHTKSQDDWLINSYKVNNYLEYYNLTFSNIPNEKEYVKKLLHNEDLIFFERCVMNKKNKQRLETALQECIASKSFLIVESFLNFDLCDEDVETFLVPLLKNYTGSIILFDKTVFSNQFIETIKEVCQPMIQKNAESIVLSGKYQQHLEKILAKSEEQFTPVDQTARRSTQGVLNSDSDDAPYWDNTSIHFEIISIEDVKNTIKKTLEDKGLDDFVTTIAEYINRHLNETALAIAKEYFGKLFQDSRNRKFTDSAENRINVLMNDINLYEKGFKLFPTDQQRQFKEYLLKSFGAEVLSEFCKHAAKKCNLSVQADVLSVEQINKLINNLSDEYKKPLHALNCALAEHNMEQFYQAVDVCLYEWGMILEKNNNKKDRLLIYNHREKLLSDIKNCEEPVLILHLIVLVLFTIVTWNLLHASSKQVPLIILYLKSKLKEDDFDKVQKYHEMVAKYLNATNDEKESIEQKLKEDLPSLKSIIMDVKKY